jgi:hypothetical protein
VFGAAFPTGETPRHAVGAIERWGFGKRGILMPNHMESKVQYAGQGAEAARLTNQRSQTVETARRGGWAHFNLYIYVIAVLR